MEHLKKIIRDIPDFPEPGIVFRDITPILRNAGDMNLIVNGLLEPFLKDGITAVAGIEARGFIFGSLAAQALNVAFIPLRKPGKLPYQTEAESYQLEYGSATLEIHADAVGSNDRVLLIDDLIATGGTAAAGCRLVRRLGAEVAGCAFVIELDFLNGRDILTDTRIHSLLRY